MTSPSDIPRPLPWEQRAKGVGPMPGGFTVYVDALRQVCEHVVSERPSYSDLATWVQKHFELSKGSADFRVGFLQKAGVLESATDRVRLSDYASLWYMDLDDGILIGLLHSRLQYFGEMLVELCEGPQSIEELRKAARKYDLDWDSHTQVNSRRGWLESAKLIKPAGHGQVAITDAGRELLGKLSVHSPDMEPAPESTPTSTPETMLSTAPSEPDDPTADRDLSPAEVLANEIRDASTDSQNYDRLEIAVRDAFQLLGFDAEKLGGSGKTDVLVKAPLGRDDSYSVTIDAKTVGSGSLGDHQVDWVTLGEHRKQHNADFSMLVGPNPSSKRLMNRAVDQKVAVLSTEQLADLCIQHADAPLCLQHYRALFDSGGTVDMAPISRAAQDSNRIRDLATELCAKLAERTSAFGPLAASQLMVMLNQQDQQSSVQEIQQVLDTLASPLVGAIQGTADKGYVLATAPRVIQQRLQQLGDLLAAH